MEIVLKFYQKRQKNSRYFWRRFLWGRTYNSRMWSESCPENIGKSYVNHQEYIGFRQNYFRSYRQNSNKNRTTNMENKTMAKDQRCSIYIPVFKEEDAKECSNYSTIHCSYVPCKHCNSAKASTLYGERNARCSSWVEQRKRHSRSNNEHLLDNGVSQRISKGS